MPVNALELEVVEDRSADPALLGCKLITTDMVLRCGVRARACYGVCMCVPVFVISILSERLDISPSRMRMIKLFFILFGAMHFFACIFWRVRLLTPDSISY
jgi:hypothetical protein